jgi:hypothetical protein
MKNLTAWFLMLAVLLNLLHSADASAAAAGATTEVQIVRYASDRSTIVDEITLTYQWMEQNLPVHGDGVTHYYLQGPIFEGDMWDPSETVNLKDKGAVRGTNARDLCELVGGMEPGDELSFVAVDGWSTEFAYENIYEPNDRQGPVVLGWYNGAEPASGEKYGTGYPGLDGYHTAMQIVIMAPNPNEAGQYVFGNDDMRLSLPQEKYQHFYQGLPSTNGLSGKWISRMIIYTQDGAPALSAPPQDVPAQALPAGPQAQVQVAQPEQASGSSALTPILWVVLGMGIAGLGFISFAFLRLRRDAR